MVIVRNLAVGMAAWCFATAASAGVVVVLNSGDATISLIDQNTRKELRRFEVGNEPPHVARAFRQANRQSAVSSPSPRHGFRARRALSRLQLRRAVPGVGCVLRYGGFRREVVPTGISDQLPPPQGAEDDFEELAPPVEPGPPDEDIPTRSGIALDGQARVRLNAVLRDLLECKRLLERARE